MDWSNYMCIWCLLCLSEYLVFSMSPLHWRRNHYGRSDNQANNNGEPTSNHKFHAWRQLQSSIYIPLDIDGRAGTAEEWLVVP